jgi:hypothetical protein
VGQHRFQAQCLGAARLLGRLYSSCLSSPVQQPLKDPATPAVGLEIILNDARAVSYFEVLMRELGIPGRIVVIAEKSP